ncbi:MAG: hypothetical protein HC803_09160 [Saprospiraceae bacterium]|nr:hypothetical protein [Saprospiraceae bacterium]
MSKVLTILNIGQKLFYQIFDTEKVEGGLEERIIQNNLEITIAEIIRDNRVSAEKEVGVILINLEKEIKISLKQQFKEANKFHIIKEFDTYREPIKGMI